MTIAQYNLLDEEWRYIVWLANAVEVASYQKHGSVHVLYQLESFYIELIFEVQHSQEATFFSFTNDKYLDTFLQNITVMSELDSVLKNG